MKSNLEEIMQHITYTPYTVNDWANSFEVKQIIDNLDNVKKYYEGYDFDGDYDLNKVADFFLVKKICRYRSFIPNVSLEYKERVINFLTYYESIYKKYDQTKIYKFYGSFNFQIEGYLGLIFEIYKDLPNGINVLTLDTYKRCVEKNPYLILDYYKLYKNVFYKYKELYEILFSNENIKNYCISLDSRFVEVSKEILKDKNIDNDDLKDKIIKAFKDKADIILKNTDLKNALHYQIMYKAILDFMKDIKYGEYAKYLDNKKTVEGLCGQWLDKEGQTFSYEIPIDEIKKYLNDKRVNPIKKQINLSHLREDNKLVHYSHQIMHAPKSLTDELCCSANELNEHFSMSILSSLSIYNQLFCTTLNLYIINKEHLNDYIDCIVSMIDYVCNALEINSLIFNSQVSNFENSLKEFVNINDEAKKDEQKIKEQAKNFAFKIVQLMESILAKVYSVELDNRKVFYEPDRITLGILFQYTNSENPLLSILGKEFMQYLSYCLIHDTDDKGVRVGLNIRNDLAHTNDNLDNFTTGTTLLCLLLLTGVINSLFLYYNEIVVNRRNKEIEKNKQKEIVIKEQENSLAELQNLQNKINTLKGNLQKAYNEMMQEIVIPESLQAVAKQKDELRDEKKREELKEFLIKVVKEKLEGTDKYKKYCETLQESDNKEYEFHLKFLKFYIKIDADRKKLFSKEYFKAIEELAEQGLFFYNLRTPDLPDNLIFGRDRINRISELYSLQLRKVYRNIIARNDAIGKKIEEIILYFEDDDYENCGKQLLELVASQVDKLKSVFEYYIKKGDVVDNIEYYIETAKKALAYWDKINDKNNINALSFNVVDFQSEEPLHIISKKDCVGLLLYFNNVQELGIVFEAVNYVLELQKYLKKKDNK